MSIFCSPCKTANNHTQTFSLSWRSASHCKATGVFSSGGCWHKGAEVDPGETGQDIAPVETALEVCAVPAEFMWSQLPEWAWSCLTCFWKWLILLTWTYASWRIEVWCCSKKTWLHCNPDRDTNVGQTHLGKKRKALVEQWCSPVIPVCWQNYGASTKQIWATI